MSEKRQTFTTDVTVLVFASASRMRVCVRWWQFPRYFMPALKRLPLLLSSASSYLPIVCFLRKNMKLAGTEQAWLVSWIIKNGPQHWCLRVWHFRATWSQACHTDNVPWGEVASERPTLFIYFSLIPHSQVGSCVRRLSCLRYLCWLLFHITMLHLVSKVQRFRVKHLYSHPSAQLLM